MEVMSLQTFWHCQGKVQESPADLEFLANEQQVITHGLMSLNIHISPYIPVLFPLLNVFQRNRSSVKTLLNYLSANGTPQDASPNWYCPTGSRKALTMDLCGGLNITPDPISPSPLKVLCNFEFWNPVIPWTKACEKQGWPHPLHYCLLCWNSTIT